MNLVSALLSTGLLCAHLKQGKVWRRLMEEQLTGCAANGTSPRDLILAWFDQFDAEVRNLFKLEDSFKGEDGKMAPDFVDRLLLELGGVTNQVFVTLPQPLNGIPAASLEDLLRPQHLRGGALFIVGNNEAEREVLMGQLLKLQTAYLRSLLEDEAHPAIEALGRLVIQILEDGRTTATEKVRTVDGFIHDEMTR